MRRQSTRYLLWPSCSGSFVSPDHADSVTLPIQREMPSNCTHKLTKAAESWLGGGAAVGGSNCTASWRPHIAPSESHVSRGSHHAALRQEW